MDKQISQVDDLVILGSIIKTSGLVECIDKHFPAHGSWDGPSPGHIALGWLLYILSESDHRQSVVEGWAAARVPVLRWILDSPTLEARHFSDDRLGLLLEMFSQEEKWQAFEKTHNRNLLRVYDLQGQCRIVRTDAFVAQSFRESGGLFQFGHSKQHRSDLPQLKSMLATLDPLSMPIVCCTVAGNCADDQLYIPVIEGVRDHLAPSGLIYVGDVKLGSLGNRSYLAESQNGYICPLSQRQFSKESLGRAVDGVKTGESPRQAVYGGRQGQERQIAWAYELAVVPMYDPDRDYSWDERRILVYSLDLGKSQTDALMRRCMEARQIIQERFLPRQGRKTLIDLEEARAFVDGQLESRQLKDLIQVDLSQGAPSPKIKKPAPVQCKAQIDLAAVEREAKLFGWRVYATNVEPQDLSARQLVLCYRQQYRIEQQFNRLLNRTTALQPIYLTLEHRITALIRFLFLALKYVTLIQHKIRAKMAENKVSLKNLIPGNPGRKVERPTTELLLKAFRNIFLCIDQPHDERPIYQVSALNETQKQILELLDLPTNIYVHPFQRTESYFDSPLLGSG